VTLEDRLAAPEEGSIIVFVPAAGSGRHSPPNRPVAEILAAAGFARTLLVDLLIAAKERVDAKTGDLRFGVPLLATRALSTQARDRRCSRSSR
jgi:hypothetical protein